MGQVLAVRADPGDFVRAGQVLVEIDNRDAQTNIARAKAGLSEAQNALQEVEESLLAGDAAKAAAQAGAGLATSTYKRFQALLERKSVSLQEFEEVEFKYKAASADVRRADQTLLAAQAKKRQVLDRIEQARADVRSAETFGSYSSLTAPFSGIVTVKHVEAGAMSTPGVPLLTIEDNQNYQLEASVEESQISRIKIGDRVAVVIDAVRSEETTGTVSEIVPSGDPSSRSFVVKVRVSNTPGLRSGMFGRARFAGGQQDSISIPQSAIVQRGQLTGVVLVDAANTARFRLIKTGKRYSDRVAVLSGLEPGESIVIENPEQLGEGRLVSAVR